jgi:hypothetical protein
MNAEKMVLVLAIGGVVASLLICPHASGIDRDLEFAIHLLPHEERSCTKNMPGVIDQGDIIATYRGCGDIDVFPVVFQSIGIIGVQYSLSWPGEWGSAIFTHCSDMRYGNIVNPGDGVGLVWATCQQDYGLLLGWGWLTATTPGEIEYTWTSEMDLRVVRCDFLEKYPSWCFSGNVWCRDATEPTNWGKIKAMFG